MQKEPIDRSSVDLLASDKKVLKAVLKKEGTRKDAAAALGFSTVTLWQALKPGARTCGADTLKKIRKYAEENPEIVGQVATA